MCYLELHHYPVTIKLWLTQLSPCLIRPAIQFRKVDSSLSSDEKELIEEGKADAEKLAELADEKLKEIKEEENSNPQQK